MATYAIGDVQGCMRSLEALLTHIHYSPKQDTLWFCGDLVNRGPNSLDVLRFVRALGSNVVTVLGNHDIHLLAVYHGVRNLSPADTLDEILSAPDCDELCDWLRRQAVIHHDAKQEFTLVHAGIPPQWTLQNAITYARELEAALSGNQFKRVLQDLFGNTPNEWSDELQDMDRLRYIVNVFTRLRFCDDMGKLDLQSKGDLDTSSEEMRPWFMHSNRLCRDKNILFGHWAALSNQWQTVTTIPNIFPLDSGCIWGNRLSALRLEDRKRFSVNSQH